MGEGGREEGGPYPAGLCPDKPEWAGATHMLQANNVYINYISYAL